MKLQIILAFLLTLTISAGAQKKQVPYPRLSPLEKMEVQIAMVDFKLEYCRPSMRGRKIFGGLEPYGEIWRTGANKNIKLSFNEPILIDADTLIAGTYTLFTKPEKDQWTIYFYDHIDQFGVPEEIDTFPIRSSFNVIPKTLANPVETMDISFGNMTYGSADLEIRWERTMVSIPITIPFTSIIQDRLSQEINTLASDYATTANIMLTKNDDSVAALKYLNLCTTTREDGQTLEQWLSTTKDKSLSLPWAHLMKSEIYADKKDYKNAIKQAKISLRIAKAVGSKYYTEENNKNIEKWLKL